MKIGIIADSHDNLPALTSAVSVFNDAEVDWVLHAGDLISPFVSKPLKHLKANFTAVFGNNDGERLGLSHVLNGKIFRAPHLLKIRDQKILLMHEPDQLETLAASGDYQCIIYGHTHEVDVRKGRTFVVNPGEAGGWLSGKRTVAIWDVVRGRMDVVPI